MTVLTGTCSQEQNIKTGRFAMIYADEVIVSHTNENEFNSFVSNKKNEALKDRMILIIRTPPHPDRLPGWGPFVPPAEDFSPKGEGNGKLLTSYFTIVLHWGGVPTGYA